MSEETRLETELIKSLEKLDDILSKAQIQSGDGNQPKEWAGGSVEEYDSDSDTKWDDDVDENGTDYKGKGVKKAHDDDSEEDEEKAYGMHKSQNRGVEVSEFLSELTKAVAIHCAELEDQVTKSLYALHAEKGEIVKALAENLIILDGAITKSHDNIVKYADEPARGPKSVLDMSKSVSGGASGQFDKETALQLLMKGVEAGQVSPLDVIKCEQYGPQAIDQNLLKSLSA